MRPLLLPLLRPLWLIPLRLLPLRLLPLLLMLLLILLKLLLLLLLLLLLQRHRWQSLPLQRLLQGPSTRSPASRR